MYSSFIITNDAKLRYNLTCYIERSSELTLTVNSNNFAEALQKIKNGCLPEIVFLDVEMQELSDLSIVDLLPKESAIILVAESVKHAAAGYDKEVVDFLFQPFHFLRFTKGILKAKKFLLGISNRNILISRGKGTYKQVTFQKIIFIEASDHIMRIYTPTEIQLVKTSLNELESKLPRVYFTRIHKSFIINSRYIKFIKGSQIMMTNDKLLPIGKKYKRDVLEMINLLKVTNLTF